MPAVGKLRKRVTIQSRSDEEYGEYSSNANRATVATVWGQVTNISGVAQVDSRNAGEGITHQFKIRYRTDVTNQNELVYDGRLFQIATIQVEGDERDRFLVIDANQQETVGTLTNPSPEA